MEKYISTHSHSYAGAFETALLASWCGSGDQALMPVVSGLANIQSIINANAVPVFYDHKWPARSPSIKEIEQKINNRTRIIVSDFDNFESAFNLMEFSVKKDIPLLINICTVNTDLPKVIEPLLKSGYFNNSILIMENFNPCQQARTNQKIGINYICIYGSCFFQALSKFVTPADILLDFCNLKVPFAGVQKKGFSDFNEITEIIKIRPHIYFTKKLILKERGLNPLLASALELSGPQKSLCRKTIYYLRIKKRDLIKLKEPVHAGTWTDQKDTAENNPDPDGADRARENQLKRGLFLF